MHGPKGAQQRSVVQLAPPKTYRIVSYEAGNMVIRSQITHLNTKLSEIGAELISERKEKKDLEIENSPLSIGDNPDL